MLSSLRFAKLDYPGAARHVELGLQWASQIVGDEADRAEIEVKLLTYSALVSIMCCRFDEAKAALLAVLSRCELMGLPLLQVGALDALAGAAALLGRWDEMAEWAERMHTVALSIGALHAVGGAQMRLAVVAEQRNDPRAAIRWHEQNIEIYRRTGNRRFHAPALMQLGSMHLELGDAEMALLWHAKAQAMYETVDQPVEKCENSARAALCNLRLGQPQVALSAVNVVLERLSGDLAERPAHETIKVRWLCQQALEGAGDARAQLLLGQLFADVQTRAIELTDAADRDRLIQALPDFRAVVAAHGRAALTG